MQVQRGVDRERGNSVPIPMWPWERGLLRTGEVTSGVPVIRDKCIGTYRCATAHGGVAVCPVCGAKFNANQGRAFMPLPVHRPKEVSK
jgi:hypothetical protein